MYPNNWMVLHISETVCDEDDVTGDVVFVGKEEETGSFTSGKKAQDGYVFYHMRGNNLREMVPIEVIV
jgi:hypothetical protein